jgi:hypothetical protein
MQKHLRKTLLTVLGWFLVVAGVAALVLPGPGLLLLLAGLVVLSQEYEWAERRVEPVKDKAFEVAKAGVSTMPRILMSGLGALCVIAVGVVWWLNDIEIPEVGPLGPELPFGGWATGSGIVLSGFVALGLLIYSVKRWRPEAKAERKGS